MIDATSGKETATLFHGITSIRAMALSPTGAGSSPAVWGCRDSRSSTRAATPPDGSSPRNCNCVPWPSTSAARRSGRSTGSRKPMVPTWSSATWPAGCLAPVRACPSRIESVFPRGDFAFSADGRRLAAPKNGDTSAVGVWDARHRPGVATIRASATVMAMAWGSGGTRLATGVWDGRRDRGAVAIWDLANGRAVRTFDVGPRTIRAVALERRRPHSRGGRLRRPAQGSGLGYRLGHGDRSALGSPSTGPAPSWRWLSTRTGPGSPPRTSTNRPCISGTCAAGTEVRGPAPDSVSCLAFTPDGTRLASVGYDGQVHLADARTGEELLVLRSAAQPAGREGFTPRLTFSRDGSRLAANGVVDLSLWETRAPIRPEPPPVPVDATGWLRQGRALSGQGDAAGAEAAYARAARNQNDGDPSPWIEHALVLWRRGRLAPTRRHALDRAIAFAARRPRALGRPRRSARTLRPDEGVGDRAGEGPVARANDGSPTPPSTRRSPRPWRRCFRMPTYPQAGASFSPSVMTSAGGATLTRLPDGSVLAGGPNPAVDTYAVEAVTALAGITGLRLEAIPDPSLPHRGPGRDAVSGDFHLDAIRLCTATEPAGAAAVPVRLPGRAPTTRIEGRASPGVSGTLDSDPVHRLVDLAGDAADRHWAVFQTARPIGTGAGTRLRVELACQTAITARAPSAVSACRSRTGRSRRSNRA